MKVESVPFSNSGFFFHLRPLDPTRDRRTIRLASDRVYTVGRKRRHCDIVFDSRFVSKRHCQIFLDGVDLELRLIDGFFSSPSSDLDEIRRRFRSETGGFESRVSSNGVFVNKRRVKRGSVVELEVGDEVLFGCSRRLEDSCRIIRFGFIVERIGDQAFDLMPKRSYKESRELVGNAAVLLKRCRRVLQSADPVSCLRSLETRESVEVIGSENCNRNDIRKEENGIENGRVDLIGGFEQINSNSRNCYSNENVEDICHSDGRTFFLNRLENMGPGQPGEPNTITLPELLHPVNNLVRVFMATFTSDVSWYLTLALPFV